jgi:hypothetical protein
MGVGRGKLLVKRAKGDFRGLVAPLAPSPRFEVLNVPES